jgi:hypothetical protein
VPVTSDFVVYLLVVPGSTAVEPGEKLIRLLAPRRERQIELRVHYEIEDLGGCNMYRIITIDEIN